MKRTIPVVLATVLLATLAGCSENPKPIQPTTSATTIPVPTIPAQASEETPEGAASFTKHYVSLINYAAMSGDTRPMRRVADACQECASLADRLDDAFDPATAPASGIWEIESLQVARGKDSWLATASIRSRTTARASVTDVQFVLPRTQPFSVLEMYQIPE